MTAKKTKKTTKARIGRPLRETTLEMPIPEGHRPFFVRLDDEGDTDVTIDNAVFVCVSCMQGRDAGGFSFATTTLEGARHAPCSICGQPVALAYETGQVSEFLTRHVTSPRGS